MNALRLILAIAGMWFSFRAAYYDIINHNGSSKETYTNKTVANLILASFCLGLLLGLQIILLLKGE